MKRDRLLQRLLVAAASVAVFAPALTADFVGWDDPEFIVNNPAVARLDLAHLKAMATSTLGGVWIPLSWLSLAADRALWGLEPAGYHLTSLLLHACAAVLFLECARALLEDDAWAPTLAALFFAVHPLRVETVVWLAERKGVLSGALWLGAMLAHLRGRRLTAASLLALSLATKPNGLAFPLVAWLADRGRGEDRPLRWYAPYAALAAAALAATFLAGRHASASLHAEPPLYTAGQALYGLFYYPWKTLWPSGLGPYHGPRPWFGRADWRLVALAAAAVGVFAALRRSRRASALGGAYAVAAAPTLGVAQHGIRFAAAERFSYLPCLPFALAFGALLSRTAARRALAAVWLAALAAAAWRQAAVYRDSETLWSTAFAREPSPVALSNLGATRFRAGREKEGAALLAAAVEGDPVLPIPHEQLGAALSRMGREDEARAAWRRGLKASPSPETTAMLGASLARDAATRDEGIALLQRAVRWSERAAWRADLGDALLAAGRSDEAARAYEAALELDPSLGRASVNLGVIALRSGRHDEALRRLKAGLYDPRSRRAALGSWAGVLVNQGNERARAGRLKEAASYYRAALRKDPASVEARANLRAVEGATGR